MQKNLKMLSGMIKSFDTFVTKLTLPTSLKLSVTGFNLIVKPISTRAACGLTISKKKTK